MMPNVRLQFILLVVVSLLLSLLLVPLTTNTAEAHGQQLRKQNLAAAEWDYRDCPSIEGFTAIKQQIWASRKKLDSMFDLVLNGSEHHSTYDELALFVDTFEARISGSAILERAIDYMLNKAANESKLDNVHTEKAMIPKWIRGQEWARIVAPVAHNMSIMGLGTSIGTTPGSDGIIAEVVVVSSFDELDRIGAKGHVKGKIVVYNHKFTTYGASVVYRGQGASRASKWGAVAALVRSITPHSIYSPHAGDQDYASDVAVKIPVAAITLEDADLIGRWAKRNKTVRLHLYMEARNYDDVESRNIVAEIKGNERSDEIVLISGHMDCWDVTAGAMDDGGGALISYKALDVLRKSNLRAKRTIRALLWTSEEFGYIGAQQYLKDHRHELDQWSVVMESDLGTFNPLGLSMTGSTALGRCIVHEVAQTLQRIGATQMDTLFEGSDIELFTELGVPGVSLKNANDKYFDYHHTRGDSMSVEDPDELDRATLVWASAAFLLADIDIKLPRVNSSSSARQHQQHQQSLLEYRHFLHRFMNEIR